MRKNQHVVPHRGGWAVKGAGNQKASSVQGTKTHATDTGRKVAQHQKSELVIHGKDGKIQSKDSHGNDPFPPRG